ncbi:hypothetical protein P389DRAFT_165232 [Cystobasidium minutum MCA 4210]|uniref:uncharacterized protein n=1 Tax=Cystobasidium minutum MCA 4210 TaxID=1397322 RepID=UPI0034CE989B|eukprot:jgi/Rhomi1/165232/fgenesh1_kg.1_\
MNKGWKETTYRYHHRNCSQTSSPTSSYLLPSSTSHPGLAGVDSVTGDKACRGACDECCCCCSNEGSSDRMMGNTKIASPHSGSIMLALAAGTTLLSMLGISSLSGMLDSSDDLEDESTSEALEVAVVFCRIWMLSSAVVGVIAVRAVVQSHIPSLRIFALHAIIDSLLAGLVVFVFALTAFSSSISQNLGHAVCEHLSRGDAWGLVSSPGSGLELCEERWNYGLAPFLLLLGGIALFVRTKSAILIYDYYRNVESGQGKISLESPSAASLLSSSSSSRSSNEGRRMSLSSYDDHHSHSHHHRGQQQYASAHRSSSQTRTNNAFSNNNTSSATSGKHSRSNSSSTVRPFRSATASRIMLLPVDYQSQQQPPSIGSSPFLHITPPSPHLAHSNSSCDSIDTVKGISTTCSASNSSSSSSRKRAMSHDSGSNPYNHVVVYAPVLMSIEEAQQLGGKEAVIAASSSTTSGMCASPTHYPASPRLSNVSPPGAGGAERDVKSKPKRSDSESSNMTIVPDSSRTPIVVGGANPFGDIKGYRDSTEMDELASAAKDA